MATKIQLKAYNILLDYISIDVPYEKRNTLYPKLESLYSLPRSFFKNTKKLLDNKQLFHVKEYFGGINLIHESPILSTADGNGVSRFINNLSNPLTFVIDMKAIQDMNIIYVPDLIELKDFKNLIIERELNLNTYFTSRSKQEKEFIILYKPNKLPIKEVTINGRS